MRNLFTRPQSNNNNSLTPEAKPLISLEIDTKTKINITQQDLAKIFGLLTVGIGLSSFLVLSFSQKVSPSNTSIPIESNKITRLSK
jgi:hypothetical protein